MDSLDCIPHYLAIDFESAKNLYENSSTILDVLKSFDQNIVSFINDFIDVNNAKVSPSPVEELTNSLDIIIKKLDTLPNNYAFYWYKQIINQIDTIKTNIEQLNPNDFKQISDSIGSLAGSRLSYNIYTTPFYTYNQTNIRPTCYIPNNTLVKISRNMYSNICEAGMKVDALFMHNLAPTVGEQGINLIQSENANLIEFAGLYSGLTMSSTTHGDNLITDVKVINIIQSTSIAVRSQIKSVYKKLYNIINALKSWSLHPTSTRSTRNISFNSLTYTNFEKETHISEMFDLLQQKISDYDKQITIESQLS